MKKLLGIYLFTLILVNGFSQGSLFVTGDSVFATACAGFIVFDDTIKVHNTSDHPVQLRWIRERLDFPHGGYDFLIVEPYQYVPGALTHTFLLYPQDSSRVIFHVQSDTMLAGDSILWQIRIFDVADSATTSTLITAIVECPLSTAVNTIDHDAEVKSYPNPFDAYTTLDIQEGEADQVRIFDLTGKRIRSMPVTGGQLTIYRENLIAGIYLACLYKNNVQVGQFKLMVRD
jgi:hypothetical protein